MAQQQLAEVEIPAHIPRELVWNRSFDAFTAEGDDPFHAIARMHAGPGIVWSPDASFGRPGWILTRFDLISEALVDHERFSGERKGMVADLVGEPIRLNPIEIDPPAHHGYRRNLNPQFTPKAINAMGEAVRETCANLIADFKQAVGCEFVHEFAVPFPTYVFLDLMALPRDRADDFLAWEDAMMRGSDLMARMNGAKAIYECLKEHKARQFEAPTNALNRAIVTGEFGGRPLDHLEMMGMYYVLWAGGLDTVYSTLGWIMRHLATHAELQQRLRDNPNEIPAAIEEFARAFSVVVTHREVGKDCTFHGVEMRKGEEVNLPLSLANRDPAEFADPHRIDIDRKPRHVNFGFGPHACLGIHLAKRELRIVIEEFLARFRNIRIREGETYRYHTGRTFGLDYLPLVWDRA